MTRIATAYARRRSFKSPNRLSEARLDGAANAAGLGSTSHHAGMRRNRGASWNVIYLLWEWKEYKLPPECRLFEFQDKERAFVSTFEPDAIGDL